MKVALVHDQLNEFGGAERVLLALSEIWPDAPIYTAYYKKGSLAWDRFKKKDIRVSWAHYIPGFATKLHSPLRFLAPLIWNSFDFSAYDVVIGSSSWYITKGFLRKGKAIEICYCHTPPRWLYGYPTSVAWKKYPIVRAYGTVIGFFMRHYDFSAAQRVDAFVANSEETKRRIQKFYRRDATVVYPPIELPITDSVPKGNYYLIVSRLVGGKGLTLAIEAAKKKKFPLKIVGSPAGYSGIFSSIQGAVGDNIQLLGHVTDEELARLYAGARAFLALATDEDFGMTPVEAMMAGTPVIGFRGGGYAESVIDGKTGVLFEDASEDGLIAAIGRFERINRNWSKDCKARASQFGGARFDREIRSFVDRASQFLRAGKKFP